MGIVVLKGLMNINLKLTYDNRDNICSFLIEVTGTCSLHLEKNSFDSYPKPNETNIKLESTQNDIFCPSNAQEYNKL